MKQQDEELVKELKQSGNGPYSPPESWEKKKKVLCDENWLLLIMIIDDYSLFKFSYEWTVCGGPTTTGGAPKGSPLN